MSIISEKNDERIGSLKTASELVEVGICIFSLLVAVSLWQVGYVTAIFVPVIGLGGSGILYLLSKAIGGVWHIFDQGVEVRSLSGNTTFAYDDVKSLVAKLTHHFQDHVYLATKAELTIGFATPVDKTKAIDLKTDFRAGSSKQQVVQALIRRCSEGVESRLFAELQECGEVYWTQNMYLTRNGLKIADGPSDRIVPFDQIEELKMADNQLKIWKVGDTLPFLVISNDSKNFIPLFSLFRKLTESSHRINEQTADI